MSVKVPSRQNKRIFIGIVILIVLFSGLAGFLFLQNQAKQTLPTSTPEEKPSSAEVISDQTYATASDNSLGSGLAIAYPSNWVHNHTPAQNPRSTTAIQTDENIISSPSGNIQVVMKVQTNTQVGGYCTNDYIKLKYLETDATLKFPDGRFAAYVVYYPKTRFYQYHVGLQKNTEAVKNVSLESNTACNFMFSEFLERNSSIPGVPLTHTLLGVRFVDLYNGEDLKPGVDEKKIAEKLSGREYEAAKQIIQSAYIKEVE